MWYGLGVSKEVTNIIGRGHFTPLMISKKQSNPNTAFFLSESTTIRVKRYLLIRNNDIILAPPPKMLFWAIVINSLIKWGGGTFYTFFLFLALFCPLIILNIFVNSNFSLY